MKRQFPKSYTRFLFSTIVAVYLLIFIGSLVRSTGSGMGCPDWPKCFGLWIPPTCECQLPVDYHIKYASHGYADGNFDVLKTWTEYINRLVGVLIGLFVLVNASWSLRFYKKSLFVSIAAVAVLLITMFQGWLGAVVVDLNLKPVVVSAHLVLASVIVTLLTLQLGVIYWRNLQPINLIAGSWGKVSNLSLVLLTVSLVQFILGVQVRQFVDGLFAIYGYEDRMGFTDQFGPVFYIHRTASLIVLGVSVWLFLVVRAHGELQRQLGHVSFSILAISILATLLGIILYYFELPTFAQPFHLLTAVLMLGLLVYLNQRIYLNRKLPISV
jgi:cytochrome c oxidase assembly protein subunit 15